jgi:outer membrane protein OmpA-like peptidoglycan-associated protein
MSFLPKVFLVQILYLSISTISLGYGTDYYDTAFSGDGKISRNFISPLTSNRGSQKKLIKILNQQDIQVISYGNVMTALIPTDRYYEFNSPKINDGCYAGLLNVVKLIQQTKCPCSIYVAAFTDNIGSRPHKRMLTQSRAEAMLTFLWANHIPADRMQAEGYEDKFSIGDNHLIRGSAYNRRVEVQWLTSCNAMPQLSGVYK